MSPFVVSTVAFAAMFGGALAGMYLRRRLPGHHLLDDSRDVVKLAGGLVGTLAALVLGLLVASGKGFYDAQNSELTQMSADIVLLDHSLRHYGPETADARTTLRATVQAVLERSDASHRSVIASVSTVEGADVLYDKIEALEPKTDMQRDLKSQCLAMAVGLGRNRWLMFEQAAASVSMPLLVVMISWLTVTFGIWGVLAPMNRTLLATMFIAAMSSAGAIYLILEMYSPYRGLIQVSSAPLRAALSHLSQ
ncbi:MAG TPA: hypothetical protein VMT75_02495 [Candidatus Saccharimonadales bacterium]|nr:hypothetical protein [Candidatus Saccharimonadales bacterium]